MDFYVTDVTNEEEVNSMVQSIVQKWGGIDVLINNSGRNQATKGSTETLEADELRKLLDLNVVGVHVVTSAVLKQTMLKVNAGRIINVSSRAGKIGIPNMGLYVASKFALEGLSAAWAAELKDKNIQINTLSPGMVNTQSFPKPDGKKGVRSAESVEEGLMLLLESRDVTGHYLHVDELDEARANGLKGTAALKTINGPTFDVRTTIKKINTS